MHHVYDNGRWLAPLVTRIKTIEYSNEMFECLSKCVCMTFADDKPNTQIPVCSTLFTIAYLPVFCASSIVYGGYAYERNFELKLCNVMKTFLDVKILHAHRILI